MKQRSIIMAIIATMAATLPLSAHANGAYQSQYVISVIGLRIGQSNFSTTIDGGSYAIRGTMKASGVASMFSSMSGTIEVGGERRAGDVAPRTYQVNYAEGKERKSTTITYNGSSIAKVSNNPDRRDREKRPDWVAHAPGALNATLDPISAMLIKATSPRDVCNRTIKTFDGVMRADFVLSYARTIPFSTDGYKGDAVTCRARFQPISGYQANKKDIQYMRDRSRIEISFAPVGNTGFYAPVAARAQTRIGEIAMRATRFAAGG